MWNAAAQRLREMAANYSSSSQEITPSAAPVTLSDSELL